MAFGVPVVIAGQLDSPFGLVPTVFWYSTVTLLLVLVSLRAQLKLGRQSSFCVAHSRWSSMTAE